MKPTLRQLEYALAVAEHRHFRRAAETCNVTQPALSTQIQQLEQVLGVQLFERDRRKVRVTAAGTILLEQVKRCAHEVQGLEELALRLARPGTGPLRLGIIPTMAPYLFPAVLPRLRSEFPGYDLHVHEAQTATLVERLDAGELDLLLLALPLPGDPRPGHELTREPFVLLVPEDHRLARGETPAESDLTGETVLLLEDGHCLRDHALAACRLEPHGLSDRVHANSLSMLVQMVRNGMGITLLPASAIPVEAAARDGIVLRRFRSPEPSRILGLLWRQSSARAPELESLAPIFVAGIHHQIQSALESL